MTESIDLKFVASQAVTAAGLRVIDHNGETLLVEDGQVRVLDIDDRMKEPLKITTLAGVVKAIGSGMFEHKARSINIVSPTELIVYGEVDKRGRREVLALTKSLFKPFGFGYQYQREDMIVALQSLFVQNDDRDILLKFISNVKDSNEQNYVDDGVSQVAKVQVGAASLSNAIVPNPVSLKPFRTFPEVDQPESKFIFRMQDADSFKIVEADGGVWEREAIVNIGEFLKGQVDIPVIY